MKAIAWIFGAALALPCAVGCVRTVEGEGDPPATVDAGGDAVASDAARPDATVPETPVSAATSGTTATLRGVWLAQDASLAVAVGDQGAIVTSKDAGRTWASGTSGVTDDLLAVWGASAADVWVAGKNGKVLRSVDGGAVWTPMLAGLATNVVGIWGSSAAQVFFLGVNGTVYRTRDFGVTFPGQKAPNGLAMVGISGTGTTDVWAVAASNMFHSNDSGETFTSTFANLGQQRGVWAGSNEDVYTVNEGSVVTRFDGKSLYKYAFMAGKLGAVWGWSVHDVYVVGDGGLVRHSVDRGSVWTKISGAAGDLYGVSGNAEVLLAVGAGGVIFRR